MVTPLLFVASLLAQAPAPASSSSATPIESSLSTPSASGSSAAGTTASPAQPTASTATPDASGATAAPTAAAASATPTATTTPAATTIPAATPAPATASADKREATLAAVEKVSVAILALEGNKAAQDDAPGVTSLLASTLAESPRLKVITQAEIAAILGVERQKQMMKMGDCSESCMTELAGALGSRYLVAGRLDRFGDKYILTTTVFDSRNASSLAKPRGEAPEQAELPRAATTVGKQIRLALGDRLEGASSDGAGPLSVTIKAGSGFLAALRTLALSGDLDVGFRFADEWVGFIQVGVKPVLNADSTGFAFLPSLVGLRKLHFTDQKLQPYWGFGLGIQLALGDLGIFTQTGPLPSLFGVGGVQYMFTPHIGALLEGKTNLSQIVLGFARPSDGTVNVQGGFNIDVTLGVTFRF